MHLAYVAMKISGAKGLSSFGCELLKLLFLLIIWIVPGAWSGDDQSELNCPVCVRMVKAARDFGKAQNPPTATSKSLEKYCSLGTTLSVEEQQFCYNIDNVRGEINRMLDMGADEIRVCKKVRSMNPVRSS